MLDVLGSRNNLSRYAAPWGAPSLRRRVGVERTPLAAAMSSADRYGGYGALQRVRKTESQQWEVYDAGGSDGQSAGDFIVGWGSLVRRHPAHCQQRGQPSHCCRRVRRISWRTTG